MTIYLQLVVSVKLLVDGAGSPCALFICVAAAALFDELAVEASPRADDEKYDPADELGDVDEAGVEGKGVEGGDESTTCDFEFDTLINKELELADVLPAVP